MFDLVDLIASWVCLGALILTVPAWAISIGAFFFPGLAGNRLSFLTHLWLFMSALYSLLLACGPALISLGAEPSGTAMGMGFVAIPAVLGVFPWAVVLSLVSLVKGERSVRRKLVVWWAGGVLILVTGKLGVAPATVTSVFAGIALTILSAVWFVRSSADTV